MSPSSSCCFCTQNRITYGDCTRVITSLEIERDSKNGDTAVITCELDEEFSAAVLPALGSSTNLLPGVLLSKATATSAEGGLTQLKLTFTTPSQEEGETDAADEAEDGSENDQSAAEAAADNKYGYKCSLEVSLTDEPLLCHPKFAGTSGALLEYVKAFMDGARVWEKVPVVDNAGKPQKDKDGLPITQTLGSLLKGGGKLVELVKRGITSYKAPTATFSESYVSRSGAVDTSAVGKIGTPGRAPSFAGRNWLLLTRNSSLNDDGKTYTVSSVWMLSGVGGWDADLYA